jgi:hypothetical protein
MTGWARAMGESKWISRMNVPLIKMATKIKKEMIVFLAFMVPPFDSGTLKWGRDSKRKYPEIQLFFGPPWLQGSQYSLPPRPQKEGVQNETDGQKARIPEG